MARDASPTPTTSTVRMRLTRERRRAGLRVARVELRAEEVAALVRLGYLQAGSRDPAMLGVAVGQLLDRLLPPERWPGAL